MNDELNEKIQELNEEIQQLKKELQEYSKELDKLHSSDNTNSQKIIVLEKEKKELKKNKDNVNNEYLHLVNYFKKYKISEKMKKKILKKLGQNTKNRKSFILKNLILKNLKNSKYLMKNL